MALQRQWIVKVYGQDGTTIKRTIPSTSLARPPSFSSRINGGLGECLLELVGPGFTFDSFDEGVTVKHLNITDIYEVDENYPLGRRIYRGYQSAYEPFLEQDGREGVRVTCLGLVSLLTKSYYGTSPTFSVTHTTVDPEAMAKAIIDNYNLTFGGSLLSYSGSTSTVGTNVTKTLTDRTWFDALNDAKDLAGTDWWWSIDKDGTVYFKAKPGTPTHKLTLGKDIQSISCPKSSETVENEVIVRRSGGTATTYTDATSQSSFGTGSPSTGRHTKIITDSAITDATTAGQRGNKELNDNKDSKVKAQVTLNPNFDIEKIVVGDTVAIQNFSSASTFFGSNNLLVISTQYDGDTLTLELERANSDLGLALNTFVNG